MEQLQKHQKIQNIYFYGSLLMILLSVVLFVLGYVLTQNVVAAPDALISFAIAYLYYHYAHVVIGIGLLIYFHIQKKKLVFKMSILKTVLGLLSTPFSYVILMIAILLLGLSSCAGS